MSSTTVAQHSTQPLNFGPEWLRALSTPDATTPTPASAGSGGAFKFAATKYRYSKDQILALRANVTERLAEEIRNEIMENLKDVESVFRPNIIEPLTLTTPSTDENAKMNSLSNYISGRTPGGGGRGGSTSQQSQQQEMRNNRGGSSMSNGRASRGRGGREGPFGPSRGNNNAEDNGENGGGEDSSGPPSSWSRGGYPSRGSGAGGAFWNRVRSYDDREQSQPFRRGGGTRQPSDGWRRPRGDDDENNEQNEDSSMPPNSSSSWTSRGGQTRRGGGPGSMEQRTKSNEKWNSNDDRAEQRGESNQQRGWRSNATVSDRDLNLRRPQVRRDRMPEWMDDNNDEGQQLSSATFEHDGTFTGSSSLRPNSNEQQKLQSQTPTDESSARGNALSSKQQEDNQFEKITPSQTATPAVNIPKVSKTIVPEPTPPVQQTISSWDEEVEPSDVATTVVEATLAENHDYFLPVSTHPTPHPLSLESTSSAAPIIPQPQRIQPSVIIDDKQWFYKDPQNVVQGPFSSADMERWFAAGYFTILLPVKRMGETQFSTIQQLTKELGRLPFRNDLPPAVQPPQQPINSEPQKFNPMTYATTSATSNAYLDDYLIQQQQQSRQNVQHSTLFNRQPSIPSSSTDRKPVPSASVSNPQFQALLASQQQQSQSSSALFPSNLVSDPTIAYQQPPQLQRSVSATNQQPFFDDIQRPFGQVSSQSNISSFFGNNLSNPATQQQKPDDIITRLAQAMQNHGHQQQEKVEEQRRLDQQRRELEMERLKIAQQAEQLRLQREEDERRQLEQRRLEEELRKKKEVAATAAATKSTIQDQMKAMDQKKQQQPVKSPANVEVDPFLAFQQSLQFQKEQQTKIETQRAENVRRYQQQQQPPQPAPQAFKLPESASWARQTSQTNDQNQPLNFAEIQKQEQEQEQRAREAALAAQQLAKSEALNIPTASSSSNTKQNSWARALFAGSASGTFDHDSTEIPLPESPITSYNQQATNAVLSLLNIHPKSRSTANQQSAPWNAATNTVSNTSLQDIQRQQQQQSQNEPPPPPPPQQQTHGNSSGHSTLPWGGMLQHSTPSPQSSSSIFWGNDNPPPAPPTPKSTATSANKSSTPWTELKSAAAAPPPAKSNSNNAELSKSEREVKHLFSTTRTQDALSKWVQTQFKDNLQAIDVPTLVQLLKDIDNAEEIVEYVQPYIGSVSKAKEFANGFISKRKQLSHAEPEMDNDRLNALAMAPSSSNASSNNTADEGFQLASSNGQKKKAKKMKGQKIDVKQLGFMVNNRPEHRDDIDKVQM